MRAPRFRQRVVEQSSMTANHSSGIQARVALKRRAFLLGAGATAISGAAWGMPTILVPHVLSTRRHKTHYLECGPADGPLMIFLHGWPEIGLVWRAQMNAFAAEGWRCVAPDLRGFGKSSIPASSDAYANEQVVADMVELHDHLGGKPAIWVGHDWGSVVVGSLVAHHPERSSGAVLVSVPYFPTANALQTLVPLVDRNIYPADQYPDGQWDYYRYYTTHFDSAVADLEADEASSLAGIFRRADPTSAGKPSPNAMVTRKGGRFGAMHRASKIAPDPNLWPQADFAELVGAFEAHGFRGPCSWYLNDDANVAFALKAPDGGRLSQPVLFINGEFDQINTINGNQYGDPMRSACSSLTVTNLPGAHWLPVECKRQVVQAIAQWLESNGLSDRS
jgi:pimeloyl-ACP methyl ester carboxylesterase